MAVWAIADLHLAFGVPSKSMEIFGAKWTNYSKRIEENWNNSVSNDDLVLIAGDISWATKLEDAAIDLQWIDKLPGTKVMIRGNHDYWWYSLKKISGIMPPSMHVIQNNAFNWKDVSIAGARLWDSDEYSFMEYIDISAEDLDKMEGKTAPMDHLEDKRLFQRELERLELSLKCLDKKAKHRIVMTHYPPIGPSFAPSQVSQLLKKYDVEVCVYGHIHNLKDGVNLSGEADGIRYIFTAGDYLKFQPAKVLP